MSRVMIDIETLGLENDAAIIQIAACDIDNFDITFNHYLDWNSQIEAGRTSTEGTIHFWNRQPTEVYNRVVMNEEWADLEWVLSSFYDWCKKNRVLEYWVNGPVFDIGKLNNAYKFCNMTPPYKHYQVQDYKTARQWTKVMGIPHGDTEEVNNHDALDDCKYQASRLIGWERTIKFLFDNAKKQYSYKL